MRVTFDMLVQRTIQFFNTLRYANVISKLYFVARKKSVGKLKKEIDVSFIIFISISLILRSRFALPLFHVRRWPTNYALNKWELVTLLHLLYSCCCCCCFFVVVRIFADKTKKKTQPYAHCNFSALFSSFQFVFLFGFFCLFADFSHAR